MELSVGQKLYGFTVTRARKAEELSGTLYEMTHDKTGAQLCWMDNGEMNKLFSVAFKTLPEDDTGVFHILEHSVLCGSEKYPVKEPFVDLMKSSMNTFLNAITFSDKTMYPVSSRNEQDFLRFLHHLAFRYPERGFCNRHGKIVDFDAVKLADGNLYRAFAGGIHRDLTVGEFHQNFVFSRNNSVR